MTPRALRRAACCLLLALSAAFFAPRPGLAATGTLTPPFTVDDLLLMEATVGNRQLTDSLGTYSSRAGLFLPLGELSRLLDLPLDIDPPARRVSGWFLSESRRFDLRIDARQAEVEGRKVAFETDQVVLMDDEVYVQSDLLSRLLPLDFKIELSALVVQIIPREKLPAEDRLAREAQRQLLGRTDGGSTAAQKVVVPYEAASPPAADLNMSVGIANTDPRQTTQWQLRLAGDLAYTGAQLYVASDTSGGPHDARLVLERRFNVGTDESAPLRVQAGDVYTSALPLGATSHGGRGFAVTNEPLQQANVFDQVNLRGELPSGYEVELYVNEVLRGSQGVPVNGQYEFLNVPVSFGQNTVRIVFYGPRGERYEQTKRISVGGGQLTTGQWVFNAGVVEEAASLFTLATPIVDPRLLDPGYGRGRFAISAGYGLSSLLTLRVAAGRYTDREGTTRAMADAGLAASVAGMALQFDAAQDDRHGQAQSLGLAGRIADIPWVLRRAQYQGGFVDERNAAGSDPFNPLRDFTLLRTDLFLRLPGSTRRIPFSFEASQSENELGNSEFIGSTRVTTNIGRQLLSASLGYSRQRTPIGTVNERMQGTLDLTSLYGAQWQLRASNTYYVLPSLQLFSTNLTYDRRLSSDWLLRLGIQRGWTGGGTTLLSAGATWHLPLLDLTLSSSYLVDQGSFAATLQFSIGTLFDPLRRHYRPAGPDAAVTGALALRGFVDRDGDGHQGSGEESVVGLGAMSSRGPIRSDADGDLLVTGMSNSGKVALPLRLDGIDDPYLLAPTTRIEMVPRPGRVATAELAFKPTGEAALRLLMRLGPDTVRGISAVEIELIAEDGSVAANGRSEYDGSVVLEGIPPGRYTPRIAPAQADRLHLSLETAPVVEISSRGGFIGAQDLFLVFTGR